MIQNTQLRIGNLFQDDDKTFCYYAGSWEREDGWIMRDSAGNTYKEMEMYPIPLTPEILEKCGFELINHINGYSFWCMKSTRHKSEPKISIYERRTEYMGYTVNHVESVHQLQNLYYTLTGTELQIKL